MLLNSAFWVGCAASGIQLSTPLILTATGGAFSERSGVFNIGMEGMMLCGAFTAVAVTGSSGSVTLGVSAAGGVGIALGLVLAVITVTRRADQIIAGLSLNLVALGLTNFLYRSILGGATQHRVASLPEVDVRFGGPLHWVAEIFLNHPISVYVAYLVPPAAAVVLFRSAWGLKIRAIGDRPAAAEAAGISVPVVRYVAVMFSGLMAGVGGAVLALGGSGYFSPNMTAGRGYIALAAIAFGRWNPLYVAASCLLFGAADAFQLRVQGLDLGIPSELFGMLPYILTVVVLAGLVGRSRPPAKLGTPYAPET